MESGGGAQISKSPIETYEKATVQSHGYDAGFARKLSTGSNYWIVMEQRGEQTSFR